MHKEHMGLNKDGKQRVAERILSFICVLAMTMAAIVPFVSHYSFAEEDLSSAIIADLDGNFVEGVLSTSKRCYEPGETAEFELEIVNRTEEPIDGEYACNIEVVPSLEGSNGETIVPEKAALESRDIPAGGTAKIFFAVEIPKEADTFDNTFQLTFQCEMLPENFTNHMKFHEISISLPFDVEAQMEEGHPVIPDRTIASEYAKKIKMIGGSAPLASMSYVPIDVSAGLKPQKRIDYLGDNDGIMDAKNPDTRMDDKGAAGLMNAYRLYLDVQPKTSEGIDLLLVIDKSDSMYSKDIQDGEDTISRSNAVLAALNGSDGFIRRFLSLNDKNKVAEISFDEEVQSILEWGRSENPLVLSNPSGGTNYAAALDQADAYFNDAAVAADGNKKMVIMISDGMPTYAYFDGAMRSGHPTVESQRMFGFSDSHDTLNYYAGIISEMPRNISEGIIPDVDNETALYYSGLLTGASNDTSINWYPTVYSVKDALRNVPNFTMTTANGNFSIACGMPGSPDYTFWTSFADRYKSSTITNRTPILNNLTMGISMESADLFVKTESAVDEFRTHNPDVAMYTIGLSGDIYGSYTDGDGDLRKKDEVLTYLASTGAGNNTGYRGEHHKSMTFQGLQESINGIFTAENIVMKDALSEYADVLDDAELKVTIESLGGSETVLYTESEGIKDRNILKDVSLDHSKGELAVILDPSYALEPANRIVVSFNIGINGAADTYLERNNREYPATGDGDTDYGANKTSSLKKGFFCSGDAKVTWGSDGSALFPKPVIQIPQTGTIKVTNHVISGDVNRKFDFVAKVKDGELASPANGDGYTLESENKKARFTIGNGESVVLKAQAGSHITITEPVHDGYKVIFSKGGENISSDSYDVQVVGGRQIDIAVKNEQASAPQQKIRKWVDQVADDTYDLSLSVTGLSDGFEAAEKVDILMMIDTTASMNNPFGSISRWNALKSTTDDIIAKIKASNADARLALVGFSGDGKYGVGSTASYADAGYLVPWTSSYSAITSALSGITLGGITNYTAPFHLLNHDNILTGTNGARSDARTIAVFITDGNPTAYYDASGRSTYCDYYEYGFDPEDVMIPKAKNELMNVAGMDSFYGICIGGDAELTVLKDLVSAADASEKDAFICTDEASFNKAMGKALGMIKPAAKIADTFIEDAFSGNIRLADGAKLTLTVKDESGKEIASQTGNLSGTSVTVPANGSNPSVVLTAAYDETINEITVSSDKEYHLEKGWTYTVKTQIAPSDEAVSLYTARKAYPDTGEENTGSASEGKGGFYSNDYAKFIYSIDGDTYSQAYKKPVVQVEPPDQNVCLKITKKDAVSSEVLKGAGFTVYVDDGDNVYDGEKDTTKATVFKDSALTVPGNGKTSDSNGMVAFYGLQEDTLYWIVETAVPRGYCAPDAPKSFQYLGNGKALLDGAEVGVINEICSITVKNNRIYELPNAGGIGAEPFILVGSTIAAIAVMRGRRRNGMSIKS